jgi:hypothetical protein
MTTFTDSKGNKWELALTIGAAKRLRDRCGIDLLKPDSTDQDNLPVLTRIARDIMLQAEAISCLLEREFEKHEIDESEIMDVFDASTLAAAQEAFWSEVQNFFLSLGNTARAELVTKHREVVDASIRKATAEIKALNVEAAVNGAISMLSQERSGSSPTG